LNTTPRTIATVPCPLTTVSPVSGARYIRNRTSPPIAPPITTTRIDAVFIADIGGLESGGFPIWLAMGALLCSFNLKRVVSEYTWIIDTCYGRSRDATDRSSHVAGGRVRNMRLTTFTDYC